MFVIEKNQSSKDQPAPQVLPDYITSRAVNPYSIGRHADRYSLWRILAHSWQTPVAACNMTCRHRPKRSGHIPRPEVSSRADEGEAGGKHCGIASALTWTVDSFRIPRVGQPAGRDLSIDALRGLAILLVVLGHAISNAENLNIATRGDPQFILSNFVYAFHMPLFMLIAGYVLFGKRIKLLDRGIRLLLPFVAWIPVYWFVNRYIRSFPWPVHFLTTLKDTLLKPGIGLWFLPTLFLCTLLLVPAVYLEKVRGWLGEVTLASIFIGLNFIPYDDLGIMQLKYFFFFFAAGYLIAKHRSKIDRLTHREIDVSLAIATGAFLGLFVVLYYYQILKPYQFPISLVDLFKAPGTYLARYLMAILGIAACVAFVRALGSSRGRTVFAWFGLVTMDIYVAHGLMIQLAMGSGWVKVLMGFVFGVVLSLVLTLFVLRQWWVTAAVFLGIRPQRRGDAEPDLEREAPLAEEPTGPRG